MSESWQQTEYTPDDAPKAFDIPTVTVVGVFRGGKVVRVEWSDDLNHVSLSDRTLQALSILGVAIIDKPDNYLFTGEIL